MRSLLRASSLTLALCSGCSDDSDLAADLAETITPIDGATRDDLAASPDLAVESDAATPGDLAEPPDLATAKAVLSLLAGAIGGPGSADGVGDEARLSLASSMVLDGAGHAYLADRDNQVVRTIDLATGAVSTLAGKRNAVGSANGTLASARFTMPRRLAWAGGGILYLADDQGADATLIRRIDIGAGTVSTVSTSQTLHRSGGLAWDGAGTLYVAEETQHVISKLDVGTGTVTLVAGGMGSFGSTDDTGGLARFYWPQGLLLDGNDGLYVADGNNHVVRRIKLSTGEVTTVAGTAGQSGVVDALGAAARLTYPAGLARIDADTVLITDNAPTLRTFTISTRAVTLIAGAKNKWAHVDEVGTLARFSSPAGAVVDGAGHAYVVDTGNYAVRKIDLGTFAVTTFVGRAQHDGYADGAAADARFKEVESIVADGAGAIYAADYQNAVIRKTVIATGDTTTFAAGFYAPIAVTRDATNLYVVDLYSNTIKQVVVATAQVTTLAGTHMVVGDANGVGAAAAFTSPWGICSDGAGHLFVSDYGKHTIRRIDIASKDVSTFAGLSGTSGNTDDVGTGARFYYPTAVTCDSATLYVSQANHLIRRVDLTTKAVTTLGAGGQGADDGPLSGARFNYPSGLALDGFGHLLVADRENDTIRAIDLGAKTVTTILGEVGQAGAQLRALPTRVNRPRGLTVSSDGIFLTSEFSLLRLY